MKKVTVVLDNVRSAFNVGAIFRTMDGVGFDLHLVGISPRPGQDKKLEKTSLSSLEYVNWKYFEKVEDWLDFIEKDANIISIEEGRDLNTVSLFNLEKQFSNLKSENLYIVFGHEINGVSKSIQDKSDFILTIPMNGKKNSLNVSTCVGIVSYRIKEVLEK